ncbi:GNAT family N-acetyltransferase [Cellvibrio mixtus]|uniref:GNAT family N-acetyltransferase n=1 Tax=Cellvibrio mixtus TaxID=39650 RepID=UPI0005878B78|nr:GNAT family N-acetyltransferase [Cellvibrio mixtus]
MEITKAVVTDAETILALQKRAYHSEAELNNDFSILPLIQTIEQLRAEFSAKEILKVIIDDEIVGSGQATLENGSVRIGRIIVHPDFWGRGIGSGILLALESLFPAAARYELFTGSKSHKNLAFYKSRGYKNFKTAISGKTELVYLEKCK